MLSSEMFPITLKGKPAQLYVCRNNAFCWGRVVLPNGKNYDVDTRRDYYDQEDLVAAEAFERAAKRGKLELSKSWPIAWVAV
jgi:hypothetical protein